MNLKTFLKFILVIILSTHPLKIIKAQSDLRLDSSYFRSKESLVGPWLKNNGIDFLFSFKKFEISKNRVIAQFNSNYSTADSVLNALIQIDANLDSTDQNNIERRLFNMLAFELELGKDSLQIVFGSNIKGRKVLVSYNLTKGLSVNYDRLYRGDREFKPIVIQLPDLAIPSGSSVELDNNLMLKDIRKKIGDYLKKYYSNKGTFFYDAQLDILKDNSNELSVEVNKLSKEILSDRNYFEFITIEIKIIKTSSQVEIKYMVQGKYSGGFGFAPRRSEYRNMSPEFEDYLKDYEDKLGQKLTQLLTN